MKSPHEGRPVNSGRCPEGYGALMINLRKKGFERIGNQSEIAKKNDPVAKQKRRKKDDQNY